MWHEEIFSDFLFSVFTFRIPSLLSRTYWNRNLKKNTFHVNSHGYLVHISIKIPLNFPHMSFNKFPFKLIVVIFSEKFFMKSVHSEFISEWQHFWSKIWEKENFHWGRHTYTGGNWIKDTPSSLLKQNLLWSLTKSSTITLLTPTLCAFRKKWTTPWLTDWLIKL